MQHLSEETLARLVDEAADAAEAEHLAACAVCRAELEALREQTRALAELRPPPLPRAGWPRLEAGLRAEGLVRRRAWARGPALLRIAAGLVLFAAGAGSGALLRGGAAAGGGGGAPARTAAEAGTRVREAETAYLAALTRYSELSGENRAVDPVNRLAALEGIVLTTRAALQEAPADPVINGYHLAALSQREALLRQIETDDRGGETWY